MATAASAQVYRCEHGGKVSYSDEPCVGAKVVDATPTQGMDKMAGSTSKGAEALRDGSVVQMRKGICSAVMTSDRGVASVKGMGTDGFGAPTFAQPHIWRLNAYSGKRGSAYRGRDHERQRAVIRRPGLVARVGSVPIVLALGYEHSLGKAIRQ